MAWTDRLPLHSKLPEVGTTIFSVMSRLAEEHGAINLGQGFPDFEPPQALQQALAHHVARGRNQYAPMAGLPRLRAAIARRIARDHGYAPDPEQEITITSGATEAIFDVVAALVAPGDEVVLLDPSYDSYAPAVRLQGARPIHVPLIDETFAIDFERLEAAFTPRTRLLILNFPHNPSGATLAPDDLARLDRLLSEREIFVLSDEVYEQIVFDQRPPQSLLGHPNLRARGLAVGSFGKAYHCTGWKIGWVTAPRRLSAELRKVHQFVTFASNSPAQHAFADVLEQDEHTGHLRALADFYQHKRDRFRALLAPSAFRLLPVAGTYFQLADYSALSQQGDLEFAERLVREAGVATIPISGLYREPPARPLIRFCFAKGDETLERAALALCQFSERTLSRQ